MPGAMSRGVCENVCQLRSNLAFGKIKYAGEITENMGDRDRDELHVSLEVDALVGTGGDRPECMAKFLIVNIWTGL
jgi:hypothetical protein